MKVKPLLSKIFIILLISLSLSAAWLWYGSTDQSTVNDHGLLAKIQTVPDEQNGLTLLAYMHVEGFELFDRTTKDKLKDHIENKAWDQAFVETLLNKHETDLQNLIAAIQRPYFQYKLKSAEEIPSYANELNLCKLLLLKSIDLAKKGQFDQSIDFLAHAMLFAQKLKTEQNHSLISYMVGNAADDLALRWTHRLLATNDLSEPQLKNIASILAKRAPYTQDGYAETFAGEFKFAQAMYKEIAQAQEQSSVTAFLSYLGYESISAKMLVHTALAIIAPKYVLHNNALLSQSAQIYANKATESAQFCNQIPRDTNQVLDLSWAEILAPNSATKMLSNVMPSFRAYAVRRCIISSYANSLVAIVAIKRYQLEHRKIPTTLDELRPQYLNTSPIDTFSGQALKYSAEQQWLYSIGDDGKDNGGTSEAAYIYKCQENPACLNQLTFKLNPV